MNCRVYLVIVCRISVRSIQSITIVTINARCWVQLLIATRLRINLLFSVKHTQRYTKNISAIVDFSDITMVQWFLMRKTYHFITCYQKYNIKFLMIKNMTHRDSGSRIIEVDLVKTSHMQHKSMLALRNCFRLCFLSQPLRYALFCNATCQWTLVLQARFQVGQTEWHTDERY